MGGGGGYTASGARILIEVEQRIPAAELKARNKWIQPGINFLVGDVVSLRENQSPRNRWHMA